MAYVDNEKLKGNIRVNLMPNVDVDGTVTVENAERYFLNLIDKTSTADVAEVKHGEWIKLDGEWREHGTNRQLIIHQCSCCGTYFQNAPYQYCSHCGAKMDGGKAE